MWHSNKLMARIQVTTLRAVVKFGRLSTPEFVASNIARNIAAVEFRPTSSTLRATNFFVYPPSAGFRANLWHKLQCSANQILNLTADLKVTRRTFQKSPVVCFIWNIAHNIAPCIRALSFQWSYSNTIKVNQTCKWHISMIDVLASKFEFCFRRSRVLNVWKEVTLPPFEMSIKEDIWMAKTMYIIKIISRILLLY